MNDQQKKKEVPQLAHVLAQINHGALADEAAAHGDGLDALGRDLS